MKSKGKVRISQCMIVKNEERNIEKALSWGRDFMYEQIVVDTGSTDRTVQLARELGAKVFFYQWQDDFASAKNYAIDQARGDWIVFMDADEYPAPGDEKKIPLLLAQIAHRDLDAVSTGCQQIDEEGRIAAWGTQVRIFRNRRDIRYRRRIHEQLISTQGRELRLGDASGDISIFHTGYQKAAMKEKRSEGRNKRLILAELEKDPLDREMLGYMGDECYGEGDMEEAKVWYAKAIQGLDRELPDSDQRSAATFTKLLLILTEERKGSATAALSPSDEAERPSGDAGKPSGQAVKSSGNAGEPSGQAVKSSGNAAEPSPEALSPWTIAEPIYRQAITVLPKEADFDYIAGLYHCRNGQFWKGAEHLERALDKLERYGSSNRAMYLSANLPSVYNALVRCYYETEQKEKCVNQAVSYLKYMPEDMAVLSWLLKVLAAPPLTARGMEEILSFLGKLYDFSGLRAKVLVTRCARAAGCGQLGSFMEQRLFTREERLALGIS